MFPKLRPYLEAAYEEAEEGTEHVVTRYRDGGSNLRTQMTRIVKRAGLTPWPRIFHNLRASRQTELEETFASHVVCAWLGNSLQVARKHYLQITDDHFERALEVAETSDAKSGALVTQNQAQHTHAASRTTSHKVNKNDSEPLTPCGDTRSDAAPCDTGRKEMAEVHGNRTSVENTGNNEVGSNCGAKSGALERILPQVDPDLRLIIDAWPDLPESVKAGIMAMVDVATKTMGLQE